MSQFSARAKAQCAEREVTYRRFSYSHKIETGKMTQEQADLQIALMTEIAQEYSEAADLEERQGRLF